MNLKTYLEQFIGDELPDEKENNASLTYYAFEDDFANLETILCPKCGSPLSFYSLVRFAECTNPDCDYKWT